MRAVQVKVLAAVAIGTLLAATARPADLKTLIEKLPAQTKAEAHAIYEGILKDAPASLVQLVRMLQPPEKDNDAKVRYALHGLATYVKRPGAEAQRKVFVAVCRRLDPIDCLRGLELNVSCPNVADGLEFGTDPQRLHRLVAAVRGVVSNSLLVVKLSPNVTDITAAAQAAVDAGADALSLINTLRGMAINADTHRAMLANVTGGLSGPAVKPVALYMIHQVYTKVARDARVPLIGMGGICTWRDAVEFLLAGATALAVGTALFRDPGVPISIIDGLAQYLADRGLTSPGELVGKVR